MTLTRHFVLAALFIATTSTAALAQTRVVDGDTFDLDGLRIRINGIDAPEFGQHCGDWDCGQAALEQLDALISAGTVSCEALDQDKYGRTIARCDVDGQDLGDAMIAAGLARAFMRYSDDYVGAEETARVAAVGIWQGDYETPWDFRERKWAEAAQKAPEGCPIKGNISSGGKIYHAPWSPWYGKTRINVSKGERWFCSEDDAIAAGWRAPIWR
ncbi:thermonuclease family protein [uncultured Paracoccus sp.]|uniref:thermonuclease family protein n=1 Tax=uncultured Paracoccus sp. TaxID=189685 RepID=UPI0026074CD4|nr:thermonuclease family protein [uncultured Paracoccus sp.]